MDKIEKDVVMIDCELLAQCLADDAFEQDTKGIPQEDIYEEIVSPVISSWEDAVRKKEVRSRWVYLYDTLKLKYRELIETCKIDIK